MNNRVIVKMNGEFDIKECVLEFTFYKGKESKRNRKEQELDIWIIAKLIEPTSLYDGDEEIIVNELEFNLIYSITKDKIVRYHTHLDYTPISKEVINICDNIKPLYTNLKKDVEKICKKENIDYKNFLITFFNFIFIYPECEENFCLTKLERIYEIS